VRLSNSFMPDSPACQRTLSSKRARENRSPQIQSLATL